MSKELNRRQFIGRSLIGSAVIAAAVEGTGAPARASSVKGLPAGKIGGVGVSRLIIGGNQFSATAGRM